MTEKFRIAVVDDHSMLRAGVIRALTLDDMIEVVGEGASAMDAVELAKAHKPDMVLLDISMPGDGIEAARAISSLPNPPQVVMLTASENDDAVTRALEAGAVGYLVKGINAPDLINAVKSVKTDGSFISPNLALRLLSKKLHAEVTAFSTLSESEQRTLRLMGAGLTNREISERLAVTEKTIKFHVGNILKKLGVRNRVEAALLAKQEWGET